MKFNILTFLTAFIILTSLIIGAFFGFIEIGPDITNNNKNVLAASATREQIGTSAGGQPIYVYKLGNGSKAVAIVGGMNGSREQAGIDIPNGIKSAYESGSTTIPSDITLYFIPNITPGDDGGGFNEAGIDVNRNFSAPSIPDGSWNKWSCSKGRYCDEDASPGRIPGGCTNSTIKTAFPDFCSRYPSKDDFCCVDNKSSSNNAPFSENETKALRDFIEMNHIQYVISYRAPYDNISSSNASEDKKLEGTKTLINLFESILNTDEGYIPYWDKYPVPGQFMDWLHEKGIVGVEIEVPDSSQARINKNLDAVQKALECIASGNCEIGSLSGAVDAGTDLCTGLKSVNPSAFFCQSDPEWGGTNAPGTGCTLAAGGCGPSTAAMVLARTGYAKFPLQDDWGGFNLNNLDGMDVKGQAVNPLTVDHLFGAGGWRSCGSYFGSFTQWLTKIGYTVKPVGSNMQDIQQALADGYTLAMSVAGYPTKDGGTVGHLLGISGADPANKTLTLFDPANCATGADTTRDYSTVTGWGINWIEGVKNNGP